jgi:hypothetical protein
VSETTLSRILRALGYRKLSARPRHHAQAAGAVDAFKKAFPEQATGRATAPGARRSEMKAVSITTAEAASQLCPREPAQPRTAPLQEFGWGAGS